MTSSVSQKRVAETNRWHTCHRAFCVCLGSRRWGLGSGFAAAHVGAHVRAQAADTEDQMQEIKGSLGLIKGAVGSFGFTGLSGNRQG